MSDQLVYEMDAEEGRLPVPEPACATMAWECAGERIEYTALYPGDGSTLCGLSKGIQKLFFGRIGQIILLFRKADSWYRPTGFFRNNRGRHCRCIFR